MNPDNDTDQVSPADALDLYLRDKEPEVSEWTLYSHKSRLGHFIRWCNGEGDVDSLSELNGMKLKQYKLWRTDEGDLNRVSVKTQMDTLRVFIRWCESIDAVEKDLSEKVISPTLNDGENQREQYLEEDRAERILTYLARYEYATRGHVIMQVMWETGVRIGGLNSLDLNDVDLENRSIEVVHRPDRGTTLKLKADGERHVAISEVTAQVIEDYISENRSNVEDDYGREPLLTTRSSRMHVSNIRREVYCWTRPCQVGKECPHDRDVDDCVALQRGKESKCPSSRRPHDVRRGAITHWLRSDAPVAAVSDRMNVSEKVLDEHYDERSEEEKMEQRRDYLDNI